MLVGLTGAALLALGSCKDDVGVTVSERFSATLSGANERPAVTSTATGTATFTYLADLGSIFYRIDVAGIDSATLAHIHGPAADTVNAGVIINLFLGPVGCGTPCATKAGFTGTLAQGVLGELGAPAGMTMDSLLVLLTNGNAYVNVHTRAHGGGEIRGQVVKQ
jgi:hypothetical protein